ncbi:MAG: hypothetical protein Q4C86_14135 [bacterium]|nr:hypothetical protein [bacterium]
MRDKGGGRASITDLLYMVGGRFLDNMLARDALARQYKYNDRLAVSADERKADATRLENERNDMLMKRFEDNYNLDPRRAAGGGGMLAVAPSIGYKGNVSDLAAWGMPQMYSIDQGDKKTLAPVYSGGEIGDGRSYVMGMSPKDAGDLDVKQGELALKADELDSQRSYRSGMLANERERINLGARPMWTLINGYTDENGNLIERDQWGNKRPAGGIKPAVPKVDPITQYLQILTLLRNGQGKGGSGGSGRGFNFPNSSSGNNNTGGGHIQALEERLAEHIGNALFPESSARDPGTDFSDYKPLHESIGDGGLNAYSSALGGVGAPASAGGAARSPQTAGSGGKRISMADILHEANIQNRLPADLVREAQESGFTVY